MDQLGLGKSKHPEIGFLIKRSRIVSLSNLRLSIYETESASLVKHCLALMYIIP